MPSGAYSLISYELLIRCPRAPEHSAPAATTFLAHAGMQVMAGGDRLYSLPSMLKVRALWRPFNECYSAFSGTVRQRGGMANLLTQGVFGVRLAHGGGGRGRMRARNGGGMRNTAAGVRSLRKRPDRPLHGSSFLAQPYRAGNCHHDPANMSSHQAHPRQKKNRILEQTGQEPSPGILARMLRYSMPCAVVAEGGGENNTPWISTDRQAYS